jgi:hypothetical protein
LQILQLPEGASDDRPPFVLVVDQHFPLRYVHGLGGEREPEPVDEFAGVADQIGARGVLIFREPVEIPANDPLPVPEDPERAGTTQIVYAHERTRLDLCSALLLSGDTTWRKLVEATAERQRTVARLFRQLDRVRELPERPEAMAVNPEQPHAYMDGYAAGVRAAKRAAQNERPQTAEHGG